MQNSFQYQMSGTLRIGGCSGIGYSICYTFQFAQGSIVYLCEKAQKGILETVAIKRVSLIGDSFTPIYTDTFNATYPESGLCTQSQAIQTAINYWQIKLIEIDNALANLCGMD